MLFHDFLLKVHCYLLQLVELGYNIALGEVAEDADFLEFEDSFEEFDCFVATLLEIFVWNALALGVDKDVSDSASDNVVGVDHVNWLQRITRYHFKGSVSPP